MNGLRRGSCAGAAAEDLVVAALLRAGGIGLGFGRVFVVRGRADLGQVAVHFMQSPGVGGQTAGDHGRLDILALDALAVDVVAVVVGLFGGDRIAEGERRGGAGPACVFPLCFGGNGVLALLVLAAELLAELVRSIPVELSDRLVLAFVSLGVFRLGLVLFLLLGSGSGLLTFSYCPWVTSVTPM